MRAFPLFVRLENRPVLLIGGGDMAAAKLRLLRAADAAVTLVAPTLVPDLAALIDDKVTWIARDFAAGDVGGHALVFSALENEAGDAVVSETARAAGILVNVVDRPDYSDLVMPAIVDRGEIVIAISTGGASPVLAQRVRAAIEAAIPHGIEKLVGFARRFRSAVHHRINDHAGRRRFWAGFFDGPIAAAVLKGEERQAAREIIRAINGNTVDGLGNGRLTELTLDAASADLVTLGDLRALQQADLVLFDTGIAPEIVALARRDARRIAWDADGDDVKAMALAAGQHVVRVKARAARYMANAR